MDADDKHGRKLRQQNGAEEFFQLAAASFTANRHRAETGSSPPSETPR